MDNLVCTRCGRTKGVFRDGCCLNCWVERTERAEAQLARYTDPNPKCNKGHVNNLPLALWDCPICVGEIKAEKERYKQALNCPQCGGKGCKIILETYSGGATYSTKPCPACKNIREEAAKNG